jgi:hypothetical protein
MARTYPEIEGDTPSIILPQPIPLRAMQQGHLGPETPRSVGFFDCSGPASRGVHQVWFVDGKTVHFAGRAPGHDPPGKPLT